MAIEEEDKKFIYIRVEQNDKDFFIDNPTLKKHLMFKYRELAQKQEDIMHLVKLEIENSEDYKKMIEEEKKNSKVKKG